MPPETTRSVGARYVSRQVRRKLLEDARARCCLSRELLLPGEHRLKKIAKLLERHHIHHFAEGGPNTEENLVLLCPTCHELVHSTPSPYSISELRELKRHWIAMKNVVAEQLVHPDVADAQSQQTVEVPVLLETVNLTYRATVPKWITLSSLAAFLADTVLAPLGRYDNNPEWYNPHAHLAISLASRPQRPLEPSRTVASVPLRGGDAFNILVHVWLKAAQGGAFTLRAEPSLPKPGQSYVAILTAQTGETVRIDISGSDGYSAGGTIVMDGTGKYSVPVPGARSGVVDTISAFGLGERLALTLVFTPSPSGVSDAS